jgi:DNA-directed RNA polymerase II subunit RPB2
MAAGVSHNSLASMSAAQAAAAVEAAGGKRYRDASKMLRNNETGFVDKIYRGRNGEGFSFVKIRVRSERVPTIGDKFCLTADHEVLTVNRGWVCITDVKLTDRVIQLNDEGEREAVNPTDLIRIRHSGTMYEFTANNDSSSALIVSPNHKLWVSRNGHQYDFELASEVANDMNSMYEMQSSNEVSEEITGVKYHETNPHGDTIYCITVPSHVFMVRRKGARVGYWTGNCSRHGQKGTVGMILNPEDMPQTANGIVPDIIINPHCIPSRMTIAHLMETLMGRIGCEIGAVGDGSPFTDTSVDGLSKILRDDLGLEPYTNEVMYCGTTGKMMPTSIFMGPIFYQRLKHMVDDKLHSRSSGPLVMLTRQPAEGRARDGGLRFGEMERDCMIAHATSEFLKEIMMEKSDNFQAHVCKSCGLIGLVNPKAGIFKCSSCENTTDFSQVRIPYAYKLFLQELESMSICSRLLPESRLRDIARETALLASASKKV